VVDLGGEGSLSDADVYGGLVQVGVSGDREERFDALFGSAAGEDGPDRAGECVGSAVVSEDVLVRGDAVADRESELARMLSQIEAGMPSSVAMSANGRCSSSYCSRSQSGSGVRRTSRGAGGPRPLLAMNVLIRWRLQPVRRAIWPGQSPWSM